MPSDSDMEQYSGLPALPVLKVLMIADGKIASSESFGSLFEGLHHQGAILYRCLYDNLTTYAERSEAVEWADVVFFFRVSFPPSLSLLRLAKSRGKPAIYCTDDDFLSIDKNSDLGKVYHDPENANAYRTLCREADLVWLFTEEMIRRYQSLNPRIILGKMPSPLELFQISPNLLRQDEVNWIIGYAGRFIHGKDLQVAVRPLLNLLKEKGERLRLEFIDCIPKELEGHPQVKSTPYFGNLNEFYTYLAQARWSIGLGLLEDSPFNKAKTNNKYREYASFGIPGIYSDMPIYSSCVRHRINGYLTPHTEDGIVEALHTMLEDRSLRQKIQREAFQDVACHYSLKAAQLQLLREISLLAIEKIPKPVEKPKLLVIGYETVSSTHIDALQPCRTLAQEKLLEFSRGEPGRVKRKDVHAADCVYIVRSFEAANLPVLEWMNQDQKPLICSWDDNFFLIPADTPLGQIYTQPEFRRVMKKFLQECSLIMASTPPLRDFSRTFNSHVMEAIYGLKPPQCLYENDLPPDRSPDKVRIGFFGSNLGINAPFMVEALKKLRRRYQDQVIIEMIGLRPTEELIGLFDVYFDIVWDYDEALRFLRSRHWDIGLAPLVDNEFNAGRQATKFRDYAWCGAAMIASNVPTYRRTIVDEIHGLLVENTPVAWLKAMASLIEDHEKRKFLTRGAKLLLEAIHMQDITIASWYQLVWRMMRFKSDKAAETGPESLLSRTAVPFPHERMESPSLMSSAAILVKKRFSYRLLIHRPNWAGLDILVGTHPQSAIGVLTMRVFSEYGNLLRETSVDLAHARNDEWLSFRFPSISNSSGRSFVLRFTCPVKGKDAETALYQINFQEPIYQRLFRKTGFKITGNSLQCRVWYTQ